MHAVIHIQIHICMHMQYPKGGGKLIQMQIANSEFKCCPKSDVYHVHVVSRELQVDCSEATCRLQ